MIWKHGEIKSHDLKHHWHSEIQSCCYRLMWIIDTIKMQLNWIASKKGKKKKKKQPNSLYMHLYTKSLQRLSWYSYTGFWATQNFFKGTTHPASQKAVTAPSFTEFKKHLHNALRYMVWFWGPFCAGPGAEVEDSWGPLPTEDIQSFWILWF